MARSSASGTSSCGRRPDARGATRRPATRSRSRPSVLTFKPIEGNQGAGEPPVIEPGTDAEQRAVQVGVEALIPSKLFFGSGKWWTSTGVPPYVLRYWESENQALAAPEEVMRARARLTASTMPADGPAHQEAFSSTRTGSRWGGAKKRGYSKRVGNAAQQLELPAPDPQTMAALRRHRARLEAIRQTLRRSPLEPDRGATYNPCGFGAWRSLASGTAWGARGQLVQIQSAPTITRQPPGAAEPRRCGPGFGGETARRVTKLAAPSSRLERRWHRRAGDRRPAAAIETAGDVSVVAPDRERSTVGHALTLPHRPPTAEQLGPRRSRSTAHRRTA